MEWQQLFYSGRVGKTSSELTDDQRNPYQRDYDRIIFSSAFRRLQDKTQVFPLPGKHFVHNRLTHSLEVASVGRSLGSSIGQRISDATEGKDKAFHRFYTVELESVIAAACLAHDIGNPPFGHSGEKAISGYFEETDGSIQEHIRSRCSDAEWNNLIQFEGNANGLRVLTSDLHGSIGGMRLTYTTLASMIKYPCDAKVGGDKKVLSRKKYGYFETEKELYQNIAHQFQIPSTLEGNVAHARHPFVFLVEAADDISYQVIDLEDAHRLGIVSYTQVEQYLLPFVSEGLKDKVSSTLLKIKEDKQKVGYLRALIISELIDHCLEAFWTNHTSILAGTFEKSLMDSIPEPLVAAYKNLSKFSAEYIYNHKSVVSLELVGYKVLGGLLEEWIPAVLNPNTNKSYKLLKLLPNEYKNGFETESTYIRVLRILDFISGMTDNYAVSMYRNLKGIELPEIR